MEKIITKTPFGHDVWFLSRPCLRVARPLAKKLGVSVVQMLSRLSVREYAVTDRGGTFPEHPPSGFSIGIGNDPAICRRFERAAAHDEVTAEQFAWSAIVSFIEGAEESMVIDPETGRSVGSHIGLEPFRSRHWAEGKEPPPPFLSSDERA